MLASCKPLKSEGRTDLQSSSTMETLVSPAACSSMASDVTETSFRTPIRSLSTPTSSSPSPSPSVIRLWRPAAQRNIRNQWSKLVALKQQWFSTSSSGRSHATSLVNTHLSQRYMPERNLGGLKDMPNIRQLACQKWAQQQLLHRTRLLSAYKDMVSLISQMVNISTSMRCYLKAPASGSLLQFSNHSEVTNDDGDGGGIPVFKFLSIPYLEKLAKEIVQMFRLELILKRLVLVELLSLSCKESPQQMDALSWSDELYPEEFNDFIANSLYSEETCEPVPPKINGWKSNGPVTKRANSSPDRKALEVHLVTWFVEVNIDAFRLDEIFSIVEEEMQLRLL